MYILLLFDNQLIFAKKMHLHLQGIIPRLIKFSAKYALFDIILKSHIHFFAKSNFSQHFQYCWAINSRNIIIINKIYTFLTSLKVFAEYHIYIFFLLPKIFPENELFFLNISLILTHCINPDENAKI